MFGNFLFLLIVSKLISYSLISLNYTTNYVIALSYSFKQVMECNDIIHSVCFTGCESSIIASKKGGVLLLHGRYTYWKHHTTLQKICWYCSQNKQLLCRARIYTDHGNNFLTRKYDHSHMPRQDPQEMGKYPNFQYLG